MRDETFERLYAEHAAALYSFLAYRTGNRALAEDVLSETFERAYRARARFDRRKASEVTWLYSIAINAVRDHARQQAAETRAVGRLTAMASAGPTGTSFADSVADRQSIHEALEVLSDEEREAISLRFGADLTVPQIARLIDEPLTTVEGRVYRALRKLHGEIA